MNHLNREQIAQAINYLKLGAGHDLSLREIFALIYLADRCHLRKTGALLIGGQTVPRPEGYFIVDKTLPPINFEVAHHLGLHPEDHDRFMLELDLAQ